MTFFNLNKKITTKKRGNFVKWLLIFLVIFILATFLPLRGAYGEVSNLQQNAKAIASAYQNQNFGQLQNEVSNTKNSLRKAQLYLNFTFWLRFVPLAGGYYADVKKLSSAGVEELVALETLLKELKPLEKELGFLGTPITGQDRISQAIKVLEKSLPYLPNLEKNLKNAADQVANINIEKYPENFRGFKLRQSVQTTKNLIIGTYLAATKNRSSLEVAPTALGQNSPKTYLLLFQNDKEIRATGGFITAYAFLKFDKGQITPTSSDDIYRLDERLLAVCLSKICPLTPPVPIVKYLPEVTGEPRQAWSMRDSNLSPNLPTSAREFERMYQMLGQGLPFDGIIYIDSQVVEELIDLTGPVEILGTKYSSDIDKRCNCPNVIYELESYAEIAARGAEGRKAILGVLMQQILAKLLGADTEKIPLALETIVRLANHKHIMFYMHDDKTQQAFLALNWIGQIKDFDGDYLHINDSNFAGGKSNLYVEQKVNQDIKVKENKVVKKINIEYKNPQPFNTWLNGINRDYVRFYVPKGSKLISQKGSDEKVTEIQDLGKTVFEAFITVRPQNSRKLEIEYEIPYEQSSSSNKPSGEYKLLIQKQPGAKDFEYIIKINGSTKANFKLDQDKEFKFDI